MCTVHYKEGLLVFVFLFGLSICFESVAQKQTDSEGNKAKYTISSLGQASLAGTTPFWHHANTYGRISSRSHANHVTGIRGELPYYTWKGVDIAAGAELTARVSDAQNTAHFTQLYGALQYQGLRLRIGRFHHTVGGPAVESLSMGSMTTSRNATPVPKIELATTDFVDIPLSNGRLQAQVYLSEGQLEANRHVSSARLHQKALHLRALIGNVRVVGGVIQSLQWGGENRRNGWSEYRDILFSPKGGGGENTVAAYEAGVELLLDEWQLQAHRQFFLEDWIGLFLRSPWDGIWSIGAQRSSDDSPKWIDGVQYEFMNTIQQDALPGLPQGRAGYYTHHTYQSGWTYHGNVVGNPLIRNPQFRSSTQALDEPPNTMVIAHHLGVKGTPTTRLSYEARFTYSRNYGICQDQIISGVGACRIGSSNIVPPDLETIPRSELRQDQYATHLDMRYLLSETYGMRLRSSVAVDLGEFDGTQIGFILGLQWDGTISL